MGEHRFRNLPAIVPGKGEVFMADPRLIVVDPDYNVRDMNAADTIAHIDWLAEEIEAQGYNPEMPLSVKRRGDEMIVIRGHCRLAACLKLITKGFELVRVPVMQIASGTSDIDLIFDQESSNNGLRLDELAKGRLCLKARRAGIKDEVIARRMHWKSVSSVGEHIKMLELSEPIKEHVRAGEISATTALRVAKGVDPKEAERLIAENLAENKRIKGTARAKVTPGTLKRDSKAKTDKLPVPPPKSAAKVTAPEPQSAPELTVEKTNLIQAQAEWEPLQAPPPLKTGDQLVVTAVGTVERAPTPSAAISIRDLTNEQSAALNAAEEQIQKILIDLVDVVGEIDNVTVDTRNFANLSVEIFIRNARVAA